MLYVILLLVAVGLVALLLKQRNAANQGSEKAAPKKGTAAKKINKTKLVDEPVVTQQKTTPLAPDVRLQIESLIKEQNYFAAEAQINQALNRDNSQHELYLFLVDIHVLQKDEFAVNQVINHIKSLELDDIVAQAEIRKAEFESSLHQVKDTIDFPTTAEAPVEAPPETKSAFKADNTQAFDQLQANTTHAPDPVVEIEPLEFNFQAESKKTAPPVVEPAPTLDAEHSLDFASVDLHTEKAPETKIDAPLEDFSSFSFDTSTTAQPESKTEDAVASNTETPVEDFAQFNVDDSTTAADAVSEAALTVEPAEGIQPQALDLEFNALDNHSPEFNEAVATPQNTDAAPTLDFSFTTESAPEPLVETSPQALEPSLNFDFSVAEEPVAEKAPVVETSFAEPNLDFNLLGTPEPVAAAPVQSIVASIDEQDPLVKAFPELAERNEVDLNLALAQQYIQLGASDAARALLSENEAEYTQTQREKADQLLKQIA